MESEVRYDQRRIGGGGCRSYFHRDMSFPLLFITDAIGSGGGCSYRSRNSGMISDTEALERSEKKIKF